MTRAPSDSDPFFQLLTDALRAGPGSTQWGEAVTKLRDGGVDGADEYRLIIRAREDLEKGRDFRRVTAGPGFTRKVLEAVEQEGGRRRNGVPTAAIIAILSGAVLLGVIITIIVMMNRGGGADHAARVAIERLESTSMPVSVASGSLPGSLHGFKLSQSTPSTSTSRPAKVTLQHLVTAAPLPPEVPAVFECLINMPAMTGPQLAQFFVSDSPDDASGREIAWTYRDGRGSVDVGGVPGEAVALWVGKERLKVSIRFDRDVAIIEEGGRRLFAGPHGLGSNPRYAGVRFLQPTGNAPEDPTVRINSISVAQSGGNQPAGGR